MTEVEQVSWKALRAGWLRGTSKQVWVVAWGDYTTRHQARYATLAEALAHFERLVVEAT